MVEEVMTASGVARTFPVMRQLRPHLTEEGYRAQVERQRREGYRLVAGLEGGEVRCVAGFRVLEHLAWGKVLYVDDLVSDGAARSAGYGREVLGWLAEEARRNGCRQLHLDSGVQRARAHRFYFREGMHISSYHFAKSLEEDRDHGT
jgi:GNAT superfamily N-acetyltransferase